MVAEFLMGVSTSLTASAIQRQLKKTPSFFEQKKITSKVDEVVIAVMEPIATFFEVEGIPIEQVHRIVDTAKPVAEWLILNPDFSFSRGLESEVITKDVLEGAAINIDMETVSESPAAFETLLRAMIDLVVKVPPVFVDWERAAFQTIFRQTEDIKGTLSSMYSMMQEITSSQKSPFGVYDKVANHRAATMALKMSIHGLRQSAVPQAELDNLFVFPEFSEKISVSDWGETQENSDSENFSEVYSVKRYEKFSDFFDILSTSQTSIIRAPAGAGKTTFSNWLTSKLLKHTVPLFPVVLSLRKTVRKETLPSLFECVSSEISSVFKDLVGVSDVTTWAHEGKIVIIFEGFDEVKEGDRDRVIEWIQALKSAHPGLNCLITSRPLSTPHLTKLLDLRWRDIELRPFDLDRVVQYIKSFQEYGPAIQTGAKLQAPTKLASEWKNDPTLGPLTGNPLLLSTLLVVHHMDGELPDDRSKLYDRYIDGMLGLWELNKELEVPAVPLTKEQKKKILELIAVNMISLETDAVSEEDVALWLTDYLTEQNLTKDVKGILDHLRERSGLLIGPGQYTFAHKSIGEFLVAQACNDGIQTNHAGDRFDRLLLAQNCQMDRWTTVIFLWSGLASKIEAQQFIAKLIEDGRTSLAAGLILERRKFLDRRWLEAIFWQWIVKRVEEGSSGDVGNAAFIQGPGSIATTSLPSGRINFMPITTISGGFSHDEMFISLFFGENIVDPNDWDKHLTSLSTTIWWVFSEFVTPSMEFFAIAPSEMTDDVKSYSISKQQLSRYSSTVVDGGSSNNFSPVSDALFDSVSFETFIFLEYYVHWKKGICEYLRSSSSEGDSSTNSEEHEITVHHSMARYHQIHKGRIEATGFADAITSQSVKDLPSKFYNLLSDKVMVFGTGLSYFDAHTPSEETTFIMLLEEVLDIDDIDNEFELYDRFVAEVIQRQTELSQVV